MFVSRKASLSQVLAKRKDRCKAEPQHRQRVSADAEADVADGFGVEALFQFWQDLGLGDLFELVVKRGLKDAEIENPFA